MHVFCVISLPVFVTHIMYEFPLWSVPLSFTTIQCIHGPTSSHCNTTIAPVEKTEGFFNVIILIIFFSDGPLGDHNVCHHCLLL